MPISKSSMEMDALESSVPQRCGVLERIRSTGEHRGRVYTDVKDLGKMEGQSVWVRARVQSSKSTGQAWSAVLRQGGTTVRLSLSRDRADQEMLEFASNITEESIVDVYASVERPAEGGHEPELLGEQLWTVSPAIALPIRVEVTGQESEVSDYAFVQSRSASPAEEPTHVDNIDLDSRLDNRVLDLRSPVNQAIFRIEAGVCRLFREALTRKGFLDIYTPRIIQGIFGHIDEEFHLPMSNSTLPCALANTIYYHKQMAMMGDFEKVFSIGPIFRREKSSDHRHLIEFQRLDLLMTFKQHYHEVLEVVEQLLIEIFHGLRDQYASEIATVAKQYKVEPFKFSYPPLRLDFAQAFQMLREVGVTPSAELSSSDERVLGELVRKRHDTDFFVVDKFPHEMRPAYFSDFDPHNPKLVNSYDMYMRGMEVLSGTQAINDYDFLVERAKKCGIGAAMGLERIVTQYLGLGDIRRAAMFPRDLTRLAP